MQLFNEQIRRNRQALIEARQTLADVSVRDGEVTDAFCDANAAVIEAEKALKWWQRLDIDTDLHTRDEF